MSNGKVALILSLGLLSLPVAAQTIEEITALQRKKLISELNKEIGNATPASAPSVAAPAKRDIVRPIVIGISGDPTDAKRRTVAVVEAERAPADYRIGDVTAEGWQVTAIGSRTATFTRARKGSGGLTTLTVEYAGGFAPAREAVSQAAGLRPMATPMPTPAAPTPVAPVPAAPTARM
jgi:hypothetical protein